MTALAGLSWPAVPTGTTLVLPLGATEQHGPHLPLCTDTVVAEAVAHRLAEAVPGLVVAPTLPYGASGEHETFPGTISLGTVALTSLLVEYGRSACRWADRLLLLTGHGGNAEALGVATLRLRSEGRDVAYASAQPDGIDTHAGHTETSIMLALQPDQVGVDRRAGTIAPLADLLPAIRAGSVRDVSPDGVLGDPTTASAEDGERLVDAHVADLATAVAHWLVGDRGELLR